MPQDDALVLYQGTLTLHTTAIKMLSCAVNLLIEQLTTAVHGLEYGALGLRIMLWSDNDVLEYFQRSKEVYNHYHEEVVKYGREATAVVVQGDATAIQHQLESARELLKKASEKKSTFERELVRRSLKPPK